MDKIVCFGKNYAAHMRELGDEAVTQPVIFLKPASVLRQCPAWGDSLDITLTAAATHYECELVIQLAHGGYQLSSEQARAAIGAYSIGLDMTLRVAQTELKKAGHPWTTAKVFPDAAIIGPWIATTDLDFLDEEFSFSLDQHLRQQAHGRQMLFDPVALIVYASSFFPLCAGDILFTGTPAGVGAVTPGAVGQLRLGGYHYSVNFKAN